LGTLRRRERKATVLSALIKLPKARNRSL